MAKWNWEIGLIREKLIDKINSADLDTLLVLEKSIEQPKKEILEVFSTEKLKNKFSRKEEIKIAKELLKFIKSINDKTQKDPAFAISKKTKILSATREIPTPWKKIFSIHDPIIEEILKKSGMVKEIGIKKRIDKINAEGVYFSTWRPFLEKKYKMSLDGDNLVLDTDDWDIL